MHEQRLVHAIRLQAAWEPPAVDDAPWIRRFGRPAGVDAEQQVWLIVAGAQLRAAVALNGVTLPVIEAGQPRWAHDITPLLRDRNVLEMRPEIQVPPGGGSRRGAGETPRQPAPASYGRIALEIVADRQKQDAAAPHRA